MSAEHGTRTMYVKGCRCEPCRDANRVYQRQYLRGRVEAGRTDWHGKRIAR